MEKWVDRKKRKMVDIDKIRMCVLIYGEYMFLLERGGNLKAYLEEEKKEEKKRMKQRLVDWGQAIERLAWKEEELEKLQLLYEMQKKVWEGDETAKGHKLQERKQKEYEREVKRLRLEMEEILLERNWMDRLVKRLTMDEETFLQMRFEKGYGFDYIAMKMHLSRATLFRMQDRILEKLCYCK